VFSLIERRQIHLSAVCLLRDYLTPQNHLELLAEASNKTKLPAQRASTLLNHPHPLRRQGRFQFRRFRHRRRVARMHLVHRQRPLRLVR
jgi:hypothetical protein